MNVCVRSEARRCSPAVGCLVAVVVVLGGLSAPALCQGAPPVGKPAPVFALRDRDGALFNLHEVAYPGAEKPHRKKQVVVLDFFRTDCKPCRKALPKLAELHKRFGPKGAKVILVALLEDEDGQEKLDQFLAQNALPFPVLVDAYAVAGKKYVAKGSYVELPSLFVIDKDGVLRRNVRGLDDKALQSMVPLLNELLP